MSNKTDELNEVIAFSNEFITTEYKKLYAEYKKLYDDYERVFSNYGEAVFALKDIHTNYKNVCKDLTYKNEEIERLRELLNKSEEEEKEYSVYIHILPNNTIYIGQTKQGLKERWQNGRGYKNNNFFYNLIKKFGWNNIDHLLYKSNLTKEEADTIEQDLIKFYSDNEHITGRVVLNIRHNE